MLEGYHYQNAYVTRDVDKWVESFRKRAKVDRVITYEGSTPVMTPEGAGIQTNKLAFIWVGKLQYELIQPVAGSVRLYADALPPDESKASRISGSTRLGTRAKPIRGAP
jgi:hypothetical protein